MVTQPHSHTGLGFLLTSSCRPPPRAAVAAAAQPATGRRTPRSDASSHLDAAGAPSLRWHAPS
eukprot:7277149-Prymnesium_polylepis.1